MNASSSVKSEVAVFAGGCFWCMQPPYDDLPGVISTTVGYTGGARPNPSYEQICTGATGHYEAVKILFDPSKISYRKLLDVFWANINPTQADGQFVDIGSQYQTAIFYQDETQRQVALSSKEALEDSSKAYKGRVATKILPAQPFYSAEEHHQKFYKNHPLRYKQYKYGSGRSSH